MERNWCWRERLRFSSVPLAILVAGGFSTLVSSAPAADPVNVTQHHNNPSRDGLYIDPAITAAAAANTTRDLGFNGTI